MLYRLALGEKVESCFAYEVGVEFRWLFGELQHLVKAGDKWHNLWELLRWDRAATDIWLADPLPHAVRVLQGLKGLSIENRGVSPSPPPAELIAR